MNAPWISPTTGLTVYRPLQRRSRLKARSAKLASLQRTYTTLRRDYLETHPWCVRCGGEASEIHHAAGRVGGDLLRVETWRSACAECHRYFGDNPVEAIERGWSLPRIGRSL